MPTQINYDQWGVIVLAAICFMALLFLAMDFIEDIERQKHSEEIQKWVRYARLVNSK